MDPSSMEATVVQQLDAVGLDDGVCAAMDRDGSVLACTRTALTQLGWSAGTLWADILAQIHPSDLERIRERGTEGGDGALVARVKATGGDFRLYRWSWRWTAGASGEPIVWLRGLDQTEPLRREQQLLSSRELLAHALDMAGIGTVEIDEARGTATLSERLRAMVNVAGPVSVGSLSSWVAREDRAKADELVAAIRRRGRGEAVLRGQLPSGTREFMVWVSSVGATLLCAVQDITEKSHRDARLALAEQLSALGALAAGAAHELNNPLAYVTANIHTVLSELERVHALPGLDAAELREALTEAAEGAERMRQTITSLQSFARTGPQAAAPMDVRAVLEDVLALLGNQLRHRAHVSTLFEDVPLVRASTAQLGQVFLSLLTTAAAHVEEGSATSPRIAVSTAVEGPYVVVRITDNGPTPPPEQLEHAFEPFAPTRAGRLGVDLFAVRRILAALDGDVSLRSEEGAGSTFTVRLPALSADEGPLQVLAVGDALTARTVGRLLGSIAQVSTVAQPAEASARLASSQFDCVVVDERAAVGPGAGFLEQLDEVTRRRTIVLWPSGKPGRPAAASVLDTPFTRAQLTEAVRRASGPARATRR